MRQTYALRRRSGNGGTAGLVQVAQPRPLPVQLALDLGRRGAVALAVAREAVEAHRLAERHGDRREVADLPRLRAVDRSDDDRDILLQRRHRRARLHGSWNAGRLARSLREDAEHIAVAHDLA